VLRIAIARRGRRSRRGHLPGEWSLRLDHRLGEFESRLGGRQNGRVADDMPVLRLLRRRRRLLDLSEGELQFETADLDPISFLERRLSLQTFVIDEGAVEAVEVSQPYGVLVDVKDAMVTTDQVARGPQVAVLLTSDQKSTFRQGDRLSLVLSP
jgi:hypothetical protein